MVVVRHAGRWTLVAALGLLGLLLVSGVLVLPAPPTGPHQPPSANAALSPLSVTGASGSDASVSPQSPRASVAPSAVSRASGASLPPIPPPDPGVFGSVIANVDGYGVPPVMAGVNVTASNTSCSTTRPLPNTCPLVNQTTTNASGGFAMNLPSGSYYIAAEPSNVAEGPGSPRAFGGASHEVTVTGATAVELVVYPYLPYGNTTLVLPGYVCDAAYLNNKGSEGPGCQNPVLSWTQDGAYYLNATNELVFYSFVNQTVTSIAAWTPLYQQFPNYAMIPNELFLTQDGTYIYSWGTVTTTSTTITAEAVNTTTGRVFLYSFSGLSTSAVVYNGQVELTGWDGNDSQLTLILANGSIYDHDLWASGQSFVTQLPYFEGNNIYWEPYLNGYVDIEADGSSGDGVTELQLTGPQSDTLTSTFVGHWGSDRKVNGVNGIALNITDRTLSFALGSSSDVNGVIADLDAAGTITGFPTVLESPGGSVQVGPAAASDRSSLLTSGPAFQGYYDGFYNASWLVQMTSGHIGFETTNLTGAYIYGGTPPVYGWSQWFQEGQYYNTSYLIAPNSYACDRTFGEACTINGTGGVEVGTVWWYWQLGDPEFPHPATAPVADPTSPAAPDVTDAIPTLSSIQLSWTQAGAANVRYYTLEWGTTPSYGQSVLLYPGTDSYAIDGLLTGTRYFFSLVAWNLHFLATSTGSSSATTLGLAPPTGFVFSAVTNSSITWAWTQSTSSGIENNSLYLFDGRTCEGTPTVFPTEGPATNATTSGLSPSTNYSAYVTAWNATNQSDPSACGTATTLGLYVAVFTVAFVETGLPTADQWFVNITAGPSLTAPGTMRTLTVNLPNGTYPFSVATDNKTFAPSSAPSFEVDAAPLIVSVAFLPILYTVTFSEKGLPHGMAWGVTLAAEFASSNESAITFNETNGTYAYALRDIAGWHQRTVAYTGSVHVEGGSVLEPSVIFSQVLYTVLFRESGLPNGTIWSVSVNGTLFLSDQGSIAAPLGNGTYAFSLDARADYLPTPPTGAVRVNGTDVTLTVEFAPSSSIGPPTSNGGGTGLWGLPTTEAYALVGVLVTVGIGGVAVVLRIARRRRGSGATPGRRESPR